VMVNFYSGFVQCNASRNATVDDVIGEYIPKCCTIVNVSVQESIFRLHLDIFNLDGQSFHAIKER
jgi:hypothetical protein